MKKKKHVTLPRSYKPGKGHPTETLAYLNPAEHELIRQLTDGKAQRGPKGVRSYAVTTGTTTKSDNKGGAGTGQGGQGGPGGGSLSAPNRTAPSAGGSGVNGSKTGGASTQKPGAGGNSGVVDAKTVAKAAENVAQQRSTAMSKVSQAAAQNAKASGTQTQWGGRSTSSPLTAGNGSYYGPKGGTALNTDARMAAARSVGFNQPAITRTPGDADMLGRMMMAESSSIRNALGGINTTGLQGVGDVVRNRVLSEKFPDTVQGVLNQRKQFSPIGDGSFARTPSNEMATRVAESILSGESPPVVGNSLNYANLDTINNLRGYSSGATKQAFNSMTPVATIADARNPNSRSHTFGTIGNNSDVAFNGPGSYSPGMDGTQVAGIANAGLSDAANRERARAASAAAAAMQRLSNTQGPVAPPQAIPAPNSIGMLRQPYSGYGTSNVPQRQAQAIPAPDSFGMIAPAAAPAPNPVGGMSFTPDLPAPMRQAPKVATDPRVSLTPLGSLPAAKPKDVQVAWNVPPMGGAVPSAYGDLFGTWGTNRPQPKGPAATPGTIHSKTAEAAPATGWKDWVKSKTGYDVENAVQTVQTKVEQAKPMLKFAQEHPTLAQIGLKMMMGNGGSLPGNLGTPQDNSRMYGPAMQQASAAPAGMSQPANPLQYLLRIQQNMVAQGASPEDLAYIQSIIDELNSKVA